MNSLQKITILLARTEDVSNLLLKFINWLLLFGAIAVFLVMVYDFGFDDKFKDTSAFKKIYILYTLFYLILGTARLILNLIHTAKNFRAKLFEFSTLLLFLFTYELLTGQWDLQLPDSVRNYYLLFIFPLFSIALFHVISIKFDRIYQLDINPAAFFVLSFFILSGIGTLALLLPRSTIEGVKYIDALFISVSAVCTTGLSTLDIAGDFTFFGQGIIMVLMQLGGLGIMTFAVLLAKLFTSGASFQRQKILQSSFQPQSSFNEIISGDRLSEVMDTVYQIILITFLIEGLGSAIIYFSTWEYPFHSEWHRVFFALFHSISAFCNTGFMLPADGMLNPHIITNYSFQTAMVVLYILGGIGFPIVFIFYKQFKLLLFNIFRKILFRKSFIHSAHFFSVSAKLVLWTSVLITAISMLIFTTLEWNHALEGRSFIGKLTGVFFSATTPRYAGINLLDMSTLSYPILVFYMLLLWIGGSPESTGGGIKTTVFSLALLNLWNTAKGKDKVVIFGSEIGQDTLRRAYAVISVSIVLMGIFIFWMYSFDGEYDLMHIGFEVFSAFNNNGLSLGITDKVSSESKFILCLAMFAGRVGTLSLLSAFLYKKQLTGYKYPSQEVIF